MSSRNHLALSLVLVAAGNAAAEPLATPPPGDESGRVDAVDEGDSAGRLVVRGVLFVPKLAIKIVFAPIEGAVWAMDRYQLVDRWHRLFWNDADTIGLTPTFHLESGYGLNIGAHFAMRDIFGRGERFDLRTNGGGRFKEKATATLSSGRRFGKTLTLASHLEYERRPDDTFQGIGNTDTPAAAPAMPVDPTDPLAGSAGGYRHDLMRAISVVDLRLGLDSLHARVSNAIADHEFAGTDKADSIDTRYMTTNLTGFAGHRSHYSELELRHDTRRTIDSTEPASNPSVGHLVSVFAGRSHALDSGADYFRYGAELQQFIRVAEGPRVLWFRGHAEGVTGNLSEVPFDELPRLGGPQRLRGYAVDRFRDRFAMVGSLDYRWDLARELSASLFVDAGRVYREPGDLSLDNLRVGYGVSLEALSEKSYLARLSLASSKDGGFFLDLSVDPVFKVDQRVQRR
jgi:outer membrane protein assembly factor BamA